MPDDVKPLEPAQAAALARIRRLMMIASATTFIAIAVVFAVIGYKVYTSAGASETRVASAARARATISLVPDMARSEG